MHYLVLVTPFVVSLILLVAILTSEGPKLFDNIYAQQGTSSEGVFENSTHIQFEEGDQILQKPQLYTYMNLINDNEGFGFSGDPYKSVDNLVLIQTNENGTLKSGWYQLTDSGTNQVSISDTQVYPSFSFRMPISENSTTEKVEEISQFFSVDYITNDPGVITYDGTSNTPININNTVYPNPSIIFSQYNNGNATVSIFGWE